MSYEKLRFTYRSDLLTEAEKIVTQDRNKSYGEPDEDFKRIAAIASAMGFCIDDGGRDGTLRPLRSDDVAKFMIALKLARLMWMPDHRDSWLDIAGYAACGFETAQLRADLAAKTLADLTPFIEVKPEQTAAERAITQEILEAGRKAAGGDPADLEAMGYLLTENYSGTDTCELEYAGHMFNRHCSMTIRRRRHDG
jgi:hypothetical protein